MNVQNSTAPGRTVEALRGLNGVDYHQTTIRQAHKHFLALVDFKYSFCCTICSITPPILIGDANWNLAYNTKCMLYTFFPMILNIDDNILFFLSVF